MPTFLYPSDGVIQPVGPRVETLVVAFDSVHFVDAPASASDTLDLIIWGLEPGGAAGGEMSWTFPATYMEQLSPSLALNFDDQLVLAHRAPEGITVERKTAPLEWETTHLSSERGAPQVVFDGRDGLMQVYFFADSDWDGYPDQLRRVRQGSCSL